MTYWWRSWDTPEQIREYEEEDKYWQEYWSHPENVERHRLDVEKSRRSRVGVKFYCSHTKNEVDAELDRLSGEFMRLIANSDCTYLFNRPYPIQYKG
jgi:hypothetical protein